MEGERVVGLAAPGREALQDRAQRGRGLTLRVEDAQEALPALGQPGHLALQGVLVAGQRLEPLLLLPVDLALLGLVVAAHHQVQPDEEFEVPGAEALLHGQPQLLVDPLAPLGQEHEHVVAQQVALAEPDTRVVDRLEDPVDVVAGLRGDLHDRQQVLEDRPDRLDPPVVAGASRPSASAPRKNR